MSEKSAAKLCHDPSSGESQIPCSRSKSRVLAEEVHHKECFTHCEGAHCHSRVTYKVESTSTETHLQLSLSRCCCGKESTDQGPCHQLRDQARHLRVAAQVQRVLRSPGRGRVILSVCSSKTHTHYLFH